jgi:hypothetical protein
MAAVGQASQRRLAEPGEPMEYGIPRTAVAALLLLCLLAGSDAALAQADVDVEATPDSGAPTLPWPKPSWYTNELHRKIVAAGTEGVEVQIERPRADEDATNLNCLGIAPPSPAGTAPLFKAVSAGGCMVAPHGCTMNFVFASGTTNYIGTAGHCVAGGGDVVMQVASRVDPTDTLFVTLAKIGRVAKATNQGIGRDFALVKIDAGWPVIPGIAGALGPTGGFCSDPLAQPVIHYGHGYVFAVEQGVVKEGEVIPDLTPVFKFTSTQYGYNWAGYGLPGDSGSPVTNAAGLAVGNLTHGIGVAGVPVPGLNFGMTLQGIFAFIGSSYSLVTVDNRRVRCAGGLIAQ